MFTGPSSRHTVPVVFCLLAFAWTAAIVWRGHERIFPEHDEVITFLAVQGNEMAYSATVGGAVHGDHSTLRPLWDNQKPVSFQDIEQDLGAADIHPPGYFYVLSKWLYATKANLAFAVSLNIFFALLIAGAIGFSLQRYGALSGAAAMGAACIWLWLPATMETTLFVRQYMLTALMLLVTWLFWAHHVRRPQWQTLAAIVLLQAGTLLVSYQAVTVVVIANFLAAAVLTGSGQRRSATLLLAGTAASLLLVFLANPNIVQEIGRQQAQVHNEGTSILQRSKTVVDGLLQALFYVTSSEAKGIKAIARLTGALAVLWILYLAGKHALSNWRSRELSPELFGLLVSLSAIAAHAMLFLLGKFPSHAMGLRYLTVYIPILVVAVAPLLRNELQNRSATLKLAAGCIAAGVLAASNAMFWAEQERQSASEEAESRLLDSPAIVADTVRRGLLPRFIWNEASGTQTIAAIAPALLPQSLAQIAPALPERITVVNSTYYRKDTEGMAQTIADLIVQHGYRCEAAQVFNDARLSLCHRERLAASKAAPQTLARLAAPAR